VPLIVPLLVTESSQVCATEHKISREDQDKYAEESYKRAQKAQKDNKFTPEITPVTIKGTSGKPDKIVSADEEPLKVGLCMCVCAGMSGRIPVVG
jgi:acetyl-CoA C-acetyltransferase